jgi:hypothetical protein
MDLDQLLAHNSSSYVRTWPMSGVNYRISLPQYSCEIKQNKVLHLLAYDKVDPNRTVFLIFTRNLIRKQVAFYAHK